MTERIDSHQHFWVYRPDEYGWIDEAKTALKRDFLPGDLEPLMREAGVSGTVAVQARQSLEETWALLRFAERFPFVRGVVGWAPLVSGDIERLLPTLASHPLLKGIRHVLHDEADDDYMLRDDFQRGVRALLPYRLVYDILIFERHLPQAIQFVDRNPDQVFVIDHIAKPKIRSNEISPWRERLHEIAKRPNVFCKISGMVTEADPANWSVTQLRPYFESAMEAFGPKRLMFGSDWPVCTLGVSYSGWVECVGQAIGGLSADEQLQIWAQTAVDVYKLGKK